MPIKIDFSLTDKEMAQISSLDLGYVGESVKHFNPEFVRGCLAVKYMIDINHVFYLRRQKPFNRGVILIFTLSYLR